VVTEKYVIVRIRYFWRG